MLDPEVLKEVDRQVFEIRDMMKGQPTRRRLVEVSRSEVVNRLLRKSLRM